MLAWQLECAFPASRTASRQFGDLVPVHRRHRKASLAPGHHRMFETDRGHSTSCARPTSRSAAQATRPPSTTAAHRPVAGPEAGNAGVEHLLHRRAQRAGEVIVGRPVHSRTGEHHRVNAVEIAAAKRADIRARNANLDAGVDAPQRFAVACQRISVSASTSGVSLSRIRCGPWLVSMRFTDA